MNIVNASAGRHWVKEGWRIYRLQPMLFLLLLLILMIVKVMLDVIPVIGQILSVVVTPVLGMGVMLASKRVDAGEPVGVRVMLEVAQSKAFVRLTSLGSLYLVATLIALACASLIDNGAFWGVLSSSAPPKETNAPIDPKILIGMLTTAVFYIPAMLVFWYAAPLIVWRDLGVMKSVFFSVIAVKRNFGAFANYGLTWLGFGMLLPSIAISLIAAVSGSAGSTVAAMILLPFSFVLTAVMYCSFYPTYVDVFGKPDAPSETETDQPAT
jgi:uncharacterized membrane protein